MKEVKLKRPCEIHEVKTPWIDHLEGLPAHLNYFQGSMYDKLAEIATNYPDYIQNSLPIITSAVSNT